MSTVSLLFPHQLFEEHPALKSGQVVYLVEEHLFFDQYNFHKQKLIFHRASMKAYGSWLMAKGYEVVYIESYDERADVRRLLFYLHVEGITGIDYVDVTDDWLRKRIVSQGHRLGLRLNTHDSPLFLLPRDQLKTYFVGKKNFHQTDFYIQQRKRFKILVDDLLQPLGGKWGFDEENRLKYPKGKIPPPVSFPAISSFYLEAISYVAKHFPDNYGKLESVFIYPTTFDESRAWLQQFLENRFEEFGAFEDSLVAKEHILHHSLLTPMMNVGLLTPGYILDQAVEFGAGNKTPINSVEGFVRQIIGWREFIRGVYEVKGVHQRTSNHWRFTRKIPASFWNGTTGIVPVDLTIKKILETGYCHHIERLMVLGNFMLLCEFDPDEVYRWFMEMFIDSYDWVMVPNVYGMSQFADGSMMATKPYISGSNYLMKMSNYPKGEWQLVWDALFWRFLWTHRGYFNSNPRLSMLIKTLDKMSDEKRNQHLDRAGDFLQKLDVGVY